MMDVRQLTIASVDGAMPEGWEAGSLFTGEIHPVADLFPMMTDDELDDLAADIKANGLIHPIVLDAEGRLIDGRNRLAACQRAGVEFIFSLLGSDIDVVDYILSENVERRHLSKSQQAMGVGQAYVMTNGLSLREMARRRRVNREMIRQAVAVAEKAPDLARRVMLGTMWLHEAHSELLARIEAEESDEAKLLRLQQQWPELAAMFQGGTLSLAGAMAEAAERKRKEEEAEKVERERIAQLSRSFDATLRSLDPPPLISLDEWAADWLNADPGMAGSRADFSAERALKAADVLMRYARLKKERDGE